MGRWLLVLLVGCGYTSKYVAPDDTRVRPVWIGRAIVPVGARSIPACEGEWERTPAPWVVAPKTFDRPPPWWMALGSLRAMADEDDDDTGVKGAIGALVAATAIASAAVALAIAPVGETRSNALTIDAINQFNDDLRDPKRCKEAP